METVVALFVVGVVVLSLYTAITSGFFSIRLARENLRATQIIVEKMEVIRLLTWDQLQAGIIPTTFTAPYNAGNPNDPLKYEGAIAVEAVTPATRNYHNDLRKLTVKLTWFSNGVKRDRELSTYIGRYGIQNYVIAGTEGS